MRPHFGQCPDGQGVVLGLITAEGHFVLVCSDDGAVWLHPDDIGTDRQQFADSPPHELSNGDHTGPDSQGLATIQDIEAAGWEQYIVGETTVPGDSTA